MPRIRLSIFTLIWAGVLGNTPLVSTFGFLPSIVLSYLLPILSPQVYLNDLLSSGCIPDLYTKDEQLSISESLVEVVKAKGIAPGPSACWDYFIQQVGAVDLCKVIL